MQHNLLAPSIIAAGMILGAGAQAADVRINGFISVVGGTTLSEGKDLRATAPSPKSTYIANKPTTGTYDDDISFKPDTIFGLQVSSNLGEGLSVTGQITGAGGEDFDANIAWAYLTYEFNDTWSVMAGRQRIPFFANSDFLDVGYAYHWMRPPTETDVSVDDFEGIKFQHLGYIGNWDTRAQIYAGENTSKDPRLAKLGLDDAFGIKDIAGVVYNIGNDNLQFRATYMVGDLYINGFAFVGQDKASGGVGTKFFGLSGQWDFGNSFLMTEYVGYDYDEPLFSSGVESYRGWYTSLGHRMGDITPHITYAVSEETTSATLNGGPSCTVDGSVDTSAITIGARWDFHPKAAFKVEYQTVSDDSSDSITSTRGNYKEVDLFTVGVDVIF